GTGGGVVIELPFLAGVDPSSEVTLYARLSDWQRASDTPGDALFGSEEGEEFLPTGANCEPSYRFSPSWIEASPVSELSSGSGIRFVVDGDQRRIRVLTDRLGVFRAFTR
ncbi:MAG: hypothetical protein AAFY60_16695, partial [Myxococcota bacterium]